MIQFYRGTEENYNTNKDSLTDAIVFTTDTHKIYMNEQMYGGSDSSDMYESAMDDEIEVPNAVGGIAAGTTAGELKKKTQSQVLDDLLFPEINPTVTAPSATTSFGSSFKVNTIYEIGAVAPQEADINVTFNRGKGVVASQPDKYRAGAQTSVTKKYNNGTSFTAKIVLGQMSYNAVVAYGQGDTLVTSKGNKATHDSKGSSITNPLPAGNVTSSTISIFGAYPYFCNGQSASNSTLDDNLPASATPNTKLPLQKMTDTLVGAKFASEATAGRFVFEYPSVKDVTKVEFMNPLSGQWTELSMSGFAKSSSGNKTIQSLQVPYMKITTTGELLGASQLRFTVANS